MLKDLPVSTVFKNNLVPHTGAMGRVVPCPVGIAAEKGWEHVITKSFQ